MVYICAATATVTVPVTATVPGTGTGTGTSRYTESSLTAMRGMSGLKGRDQVMASALYHVNSVLPGDRRLLLRVVTVQRTLSEHGNDVGSEWCVCQCRICRV